MSDRDDLERDIAEEDELASILRPSDRRGLIPPFAEVTRRAEQHRHMSPAFALAAAIALVVVVVAGVGGWRAASTAITPTGSPAPSPTRDASASGPPCFAPAPANALVGLRPSGRWLLTSLDAVQPTDPQKNQMRWVLRFATQQGAPGPAVVSVSAKITAGDRSPLHVLGYETLEPQQGTVSETDLLNVKPCVSVVLVIRTAGPLIDGIYPYTVTVEKVALPEGGTVSETFALLLDCSNRTFTCGHAGTSMTPPPTPTAVAGVLKPAFGIIYDGVRQGWEKGSAPLVRREGESHIAVGELAPSFFNQFMGSVSPDGRRAVYFAQRQGQPWALYLLDASTNPNDQRVIRTIPDEIPTEPPVWSFDGNGVAFVVMDAGANQGVKPKYAALRTLDTASGTVTEVARVDDGSHYSVVGWDRASSTLAAVIYPYAAAATRYLVFAPSGSKSWTLDGEYSMSAAPNGRDVAGVRCDRQGNGGCALWTWTLANFGSKVDQNVGPNLSLASFGWRPGTGELGLMVGTAGAPLDRIELWSASGGRRLVAQIPGTDYSRPFFRADGSAVIVQTRQTEASILDLATGVLSSFPLHAPEEPSESNRIRASIRLGS
jgi:hypothetical protein